MAARAATYGTGSRLICHSPPSATGTARVAKSFRLVMILDTTFSFFRLDAPPAAEYPRSPGLRALSNWSFGLEREHPTFGQSRICQNGGRRASLVPVGSICYILVIAPARGKSPASIPAVVAELVDALA